MSVSTFPNRQNQQSMQQWMIKYVQTKVTTPMIKYLQRSREKPKLIILQISMEALSMKARLTTLRIKGLRWVDDKISNTLTKCSCHLLTMKFSMSFALMLFWIIQPFVQFVFDIFFPYSCSRVPCRCSCFEACYFRASIAVVLVSVFIFQVALLVI